MPIIEDYAAIAKRLRELQAPPQRAGSTDQFEQWRGLAHETARRYVENRRRQIVGTPIIFPRRTN